MILKHQWSNTNLTDIYDKRASERKNCEIQPNLNQMIFYVQYEHMIWAVLD